MKISLIKNRFVYKLLKPCVMVQFSPPRSGSTLIFNIMQELFPRKKIIKVHTFRSICEELKVVVTYRHPLDSIASSIMRYGHSVPTDELIEKEIQKFNNSGLPELPKIKDKSNVLMLQYEKFLYDFEYIFDNFETFFNIKIPLQKREILENKYKIENVEKIISGLDSFADYDRKTQWHGKHISKYKGASNYYTEFFTEKQIRYLKKQYAEILDSMGYE